MGSAIFALATGVLAVRGGIYAFRRKRWGLALMVAVAVFFSLAHRHCLKHTVVFPFYSSGMGTFSASRNSRHWSDCSIQERV